MSYSDAMWTNRGLKFNDDPIRTNIISMIIKLFYSGTATRSFFIVKIAMRTLPVSQVSQVNCSYMAIKLSPTQSTFQKVVKQVTKGQRKGTGIYYRC